MSLRLVLEDKNGNVTRQISLNHKNPNSKGKNTAQLIHRQDTKRIELVTDTDGLIQQKIAFSTIADLDFDEMGTSRVAIGNYGSLRLVSEVGTVQNDGFIKEEETSDIRKSLLASLLLLLMIISVFMFAPRESAKIEEQLKQQVVKIVKHVEQRAKTVAPTTMSDVTATTTPTKKNAEMVKRQGALSVLGSLKSGKNRGGLNLGAVNTTAGAGLGGTGGSGGVQTSLYGKGINSAPLGPGQNISGGGGYGTKGKGGGQAGYGSLSLVGSAGGAPIPLGAEAEVAAGLDKSAIDEVIRRNLGQVRFCYEQALQGNAGLNGRVAMGFTIGGNGLVKSASVENSSMANKGVEDCITMRLKTWKFPLPQGGVDVKVTYPFVLRRQGQG